MLQYYEPSVRPVIRAQTVVIVSFGMQITQLFELVKTNRLRHIRNIYSSFYSKEEKTQILTTNARIEQKWIDENLAWNRSEHDGITSIRLPSYRIWLPDSYIYNAAFDVSGHTSTQGVVNGMKFSIII